MKAEPQKQIETPAHVGLAVEAARDRKAHGLRLLYLGEVSDFTDYFLICSGKSDRQVLAIGEAIDKRLRDEGTRPLHREGLREGKWVLLDYGDLVVHIFDDERRAFYRLDLLWSDAPELMSEDSRDGKAPRDVEARVENEATD